jgi:hypothetical protein
MAILVYFGGSAGNTEKYTTFETVVLVTVSTTVQFLMIGQWGPKHVGVYVYWNITVIVHKFVCFVG